MDWKIAKPIVTKLVAEKGKTLGGLAKEIGISTSTVYSAFKPETVDIGVKLLGQILGACKRSIGWLENEVRRASREPVAEDFNEWKETIKADPPARGKKAATK